MARYIIDISRLRRQAKAARANAEKLGVKLYFALKGCPYEPIFPVLSDSVYGTTATGVVEARLGAKMGKEVHVHSPAYRAEDISELCHLCSTIVFNSFGQYDRFSAEVRRHGKTVALRVNPGHSVSCSWKYDTCSKYSRYGEPLADVLADPRYADIHDLHLHALNDADGDGFAEMVENVVALLGNNSHPLHTINLGGGMKISDADFVTPRAVSAVAALRKNTGAELLIEPSEYLVNEGGLLEGTVLDIFDRGGKSIAILDCSAACHMPDVIHMPYVPDIVSPETVELTDNTPRTILAGNTCLACDVIGEYAFKKPLSIGETVIFGGMGAYTFCQASTFNGIPIPEITILDH